MAKITALPATEALTGDEFIPIVQGADTRRATMTAFREQITPFLQYWYKGEAGNTGPANSTYTSVAALRAADVGNRSAILSVPRVGGTFAWLIGDFSEQVASAPPGVGVFIPSDEDPAGTNGCWVRQFTGITAALEAMGPVDLGWFDATSDDQTDDAPALRGALSYRGALLAGTSRVVTDQGGIPFRQQGFSYFAAAIIDRSGVRLQGPGVLHAKGHTGTPGTYVEPILATPRNAEMGTYQNITIQDVRFDLSDDGNTTSTNQRAGHFTCVDKFTLRDVGIFTSGARRGYGFHLDNCRDTLITSFRLDKVTGGINMRYARGGVISGATFSDFSEAIDFDGIADCFVAANMSFRSTRRNNQCIDLNSARRFVAANFTAENVGNLVTVNYKDTTPPDYKAFLEQTDASVPVATRSPSQGVVIANFSAKDAGDASIPAIIIGTDFATNFAEGPVQDVVVANGVLNGGGMILVTGADMVPLSNLTLRNIVSPESSSYGAITLAEDNFSDGTTNFPLRAILRDVTIDTCNRGALRAGSPTMLRINGLRVRNANTSGSTDPAIQILNIRADGKVWIDGLDVDGDVKISALDPAARIYWGPNNRINGLLTIQNQAHKAALGRGIVVNAGDIASTVTRLIPVFTARRPTTILRCGMMLGANIAQDAANTKAFSFKTRVAGVAADVTIGTIANQTQPLSALTAYDAGFAAERTGLKLAAGDTLFVSVSHSGQGQAVVAAQFTAELLEY